MLRLVLLDLFCFASPFCVDVAGQNADGMMDRVGAANFIDSCCHDQCKPSDDRVSKFFRCLEVSLT